MKYILIGISIVFALIAGPNVYGQRFFGQWECLTVSPERDLLRDSLEIMSYSRGSSVKCKAIQIHFHIVRRSNGTGGLTNVQVNTVFEIMNNDFVDLAVTFVEEGRSFINSDYFHNSFDSDKFFELITVDFEPHRIDIYLLPETSGWGGRADGIPSSALVIDGDLAQTSVVSHEVGHCLGLYHTHSGRGCGDNANCPENIDGSNCTTCGDLVCDTPADPCLSGVVDGFCNYTGGGGFNPDADNIMSYTLPNCMENLTFGQMERIHTMIDNSSILQNVLTTFPISGPDYLCSTNTFTLQNVPAGSTVNWIAEPGSLFSNNPPSGSGTSAPLSPNSSFASGQATVTFTIETPCGEMEVKKSFWVGTPSFTSPTVDGNPYIIGSCHGVCPGFHQAEVTIGGLTNAMPPDVNWQLSGGPVSWSWDHFTSRITFEVQPMTSFPFSFNGTATNPCGSTPFTFCFISGPNCPMGSYTLSPNPADGEVVVTNQAATEEDTDQVVEILIISHSFETVYSMTAKGKKIRVPTGQLPNGQYIIQISDKNGVYRKHLIIRH